MRFLLLALMLLSAWPALAQAPELTFGADAKSDVP
jgi:hypothetical protein